MDEGIETKKYTAKEEDDDYFADVGFMFEAQQPVRYERFDWDVVGDAGKEQKVTVALHVVDDIPGAVQSGHYLWPAAAMLSKYLIHRYPPSSSLIVRTVVELGAGCGLASLTTLQLWQETIQCLCLTDHDPGTLVRARDNLETTVQRLVVETKDDEQLNTVINSIASIPVLFEMLQWGDQSRVDQLLQSVIPERLPSSLLSSAHGPSPSAEHKESIPIDVVLGSDLIYCADVVEPLLDTAAQMMGRTGRFLLAQSFAYDRRTEQEIDRMCALHSLQRDIVVDFDDDTTTFGKGRIQEFHYVRTSGVE